MLTGFLTSSGWNAKLILSTERNAPTPSDVPVRKYLDETFPAPPFIAARAPVGLESICSGSAALRHIYIYADQCPYTPQMLDGVADVARVTNRAV